MKKKDIINICKSTEEQVKKTIGANVKHVRKGRSQSARRIAEKLNISRVALTHIENGRNNINAVQLWKLACVLGCSISEFFPNIPDGFALTNADYTNIAKEDERAVEWAKNLFSDQM